MAKRSSRKKSRRRKKAGSLKEKLAAIRSVRVDGARRYLAGAAWMLGLGGLVAAWILGVPKLTASAAAPFSSSTCPCGWTAICTRCWK